jgi:NADPH:quinone reductase-like Zn-dependent oxidoreductase
VSRAIKFAKAGGPEVLEFFEMEIPAPGPNEVRIKVKAIGINRAESMWRHDAYIEPVAKFPAGLGYEAAGRVDSVGRDVRGVGRRNLGESDQSGKRRTRGRRNCTSFRNHHQHGRTFIDGGAG